MTNEEMRIEIAKACGWVWYKIPKHPMELGCQEYRCLCHPSIHEYEGQSKEWLIRADGTERICAMGFMEVNGYVPNYPQDLNACREMEETLSDEDYHLFFKHLVGLIRPRNAEFAARSTALQRCEAFLKTKGLWREEGK